MLFSLIIAYFLLAYVHFINAIVLDLGVVYKVLAVICGVLFTFTFINYINLAIDNGVNYCR